MKRQKRNQKIFSLAASILFMGCLTLPTIVWGVLSLTAGSDSAIMEQLDYDLGENRNKAEFPQEFDAASFPAKLEAYYNDRVPFRSVIISANTAITTYSEDIYRQKIRPVLISLLYPTDDKSSGGTLVDNNLDSLFGQQSGSATPTPESSQPEPSIPEAPEHEYAETERLDATCIEDGYIVYTCSKCQDSYTVLQPATGHDYVVMETVEPDYDNYGYSLCRCSLCELESKLNFTEKLIDTTYLPPNIMNEQTIEGRRNWLFYAGNNSVAYYKGSNLLDQETLDDYSARVTTLQELCDSKGIQLQLMIIPNKEQVYDEYMPSYNIEDPYKRVSRLADHILETTGVKILYPLEELKAGKLYWQTYCKYDTHWTHAGAFIATQLLYNALGLPTTSVTEMEYDITYRSGGDLTILGALDAGKYTSDPVYAPVYKEEVNLLETKGQRDGTGTFTATSDSSNESNLVLIGDSFRIQMIPYLERDFSHVTITHRDNLGSASIIKAVKNADILLVTAVERYDNRMMNSISTLIEILSETETDS